ncbi:MAG: DNA replication and repair protein RecF [Alphaproteobacteria bacterium]|nr:DNA replication and repair protein RecF [Alphaproteobacteria bacterium]
MRIENLSLFDFRNYTQKSFSFEGDFTMFYGKNGVGKTNVIEALSFLSQNGTFRKNKLEEIGRLKEAKHTGWDVSAKVVTKQIPYKVETGYDKSTSILRKVNIDGRKKSPKDLADLIRCVVLTPVMDKIFVEGAPAIRRVIDRMIVSFDSKHADRLTQLNKLLKERSALCEKGVCSTWQDVNGRILAEQAVAVAVARLDFIENLNAVLKEHQTLFPSVSLTCSGMLEDKLQKASALEVEEFYELYLKKNRDWTSIDGAHRSVFDLRHMDKNMPAGLCSTGEQKTMLLSLLLGHAILIQKVFGEIPIFLLDEVLSHLDEKHRHVLFEELKKLKAQVFMTDVEGKPVDGIDMQRIAL